MTRKLRNACAALTFAIVFGACGGKPQEVTTFEVDSAGRPRMDTAQVVLVQSRAEVSNGVAYSWDCNGDSSIFGGEVKLYWFNGIASSPCRGFGAGGNNAMQVSLTLWNWPGTSSPMAWDIGSAHVKAHDHGSTHHSRMVFYRNAEGGNFSPTVGPIFGLQPGAQSAGWDPISPGWQLAANFDTSNPVMEKNTGSIDFTRWCGPGFTSC